MKLPLPFIRLPLRFDAVRLREELARIPDSAWAVHPTGYKGNSAARLISVNGEENDEMTGGPMLPTLHLMQSPYIQQVLASFATVWSRSRLMRLAPGAIVPQHVDINYHWFRRVRVHIPIVTHPDVRFYCGDQAIHMAAGEAWIFDNWRSHRVENDSSLERVHLVADTTGSAAFWNFVTLGMQGQADYAIPYRAASSVRVPTERHNLYKVIPPSEIDQLLLDLSTELEAAETASPALPAFRALLDAFCNDWRQLWAVYGDEDDGQEQYRRMLDAMQNQALTLADKLYVRSNRRPAIEVLNARLLYAVNPEHRAITTRVDGIRDLAASAQPTGEMTSPRLDRPVFIVAAPRSGSTLLYETLAASPQFWTLGGEAHWLIEGINAFRPGAHNVDSNRLTAEHVSADTRVAIPQRICGRLENFGGRSWEARDGDRVRLLEKTPKNALRIPFFDSIFPDALFVFLWRDPRENLNSIIEAWNSGRWVTYPALPEWDGPWSLLLPPDWQRLRGRSIGEIAAFQWETTNRLVMDDLGNLPPHRHLTIRYDELVADPRQVVTSLCRFAGLAFDTAYENRVAASAPLSKYTLTPPRAEKWRDNAALIEPQMFALQSTWSRLQRF